MIARLIRNIGVVMAFGLAFVIALLAFVVLFGISFVTWDWNMFTQGFFNINWQNIRLTFIIGCFVGILVWIFE